MDAAADYTAAARFLERPLPAYVTYVERTFGRAGTMEQAESQTIVVRTSDGAVVKGNPGKVKVSMDGDERVDPVSHPPFVPACYAGATATMSAWDGREAEAIALRDTCHRTNPDETDFDTLYVDPKTHEPVAAVGRRDDDHVSVTLVERLAHVGDRVMPSGLDVHIQGHGIVGFLDVHAGQEYTGYRFGDTAP